jgi:hypothetical protein
MVGVGVVPLTPLIWLLVFVRTSAPWPGGVRLQFWQTQAIGAALAVCGALLILATLRKGRGTPS